MKILQKAFRLPPFRRGFHLIDDIVYMHFKELSEIRTGLLHLFLKHTSASLALGENADPSVRIDLENYFTDSIDSKPYFTHTLEGADDMPAHIKSIMIGTSLTIPVTEGKCNLGVWQGIYLCEHRDYASGREIIMTLTGE
jgi:secondary thiamine-phosphate synthase enzyme